MPHAKQIANEIKKELAMEDLPKDVLDTNRWDRIRKLLEPFFDQHLIHENEREELTDKVIHKLRSILPKERLEDPFEKKIKIDNQIERVTEQDHFNDPEVVPKVDKQGKIFHEVIKFK